MLRPGIASAKYCVCPFFRIFRFQECPYALREPTQEPCPIAARLTLVHVRNHGRLEIESFMPPGLRRVPDLARFVRYVADDAALLGL